MTERHLSVDPQVLQDGISRPMSAIFAAHIRSQTLQRKESDSDSVMLIEPPVTSSNKLSEHIGMIIMNY